MFKRFLICITLLFQNICFAQKVLICNEVNNTTFVHLPTPLSIAIEGVTYTNLIVTSDNGVVVRNLNNYILYANKIGDANITVKAKVNRILKTLATTTFRIHDLPPPIFKIGSGRDSVPVIEIASQLFSRADFESDNIICSEWFRYTIESFSIQIINDSTITKPHINIGNELDFTTKTLLKGLIPNNKVLITNVLATGSDGLKRKAKATIITVY